MNEWELHQQQQAQQQQHHHQQRQQGYHRSQSVSIPSAQFSGSSQPTTHYAAPTEYGQQQYERRPQYPIPPLQVNPSSFLQSDAPMNLPSSSLPGAPSMSRSDRHRTQSVALTSIGQREGSYGPGASYSHSHSRMSHSHRGGPPQPYAPEATVPISRHSSSSRSWTMPYQGESAEGQPVPYISSVMSPYAQPAMGGMHPSRVMPPLSELDRRSLPTVEEAQPKAKPHTCDQCGAAFSRAHDLKRHVETHKGDRPHKCPSCTKAFSRKDALQRHQSMAQCGLDGQDSGY